MKRIVKMNLLVLAAVVLFTAVFTACEEPEPTYTVWVGSMSYSEFQTGFNDTVEVDNLVKVSNLTGTKRDELVTVLNGQKNDWTEDEIYKYFHDVWLLTETLSNELTKWLIEESPRYAATRFTNGVEIIIK